jgi:glutamate dehydrogenase/leucine dehydrogenase
MTLDALEYLGLPCKNARIVIQGFGKVGSVAARLIVEAGARIIAVSDVMGGIYNEKGLDPADVLRHCRETGSVVEYPGADAISNRELLELECEVLIPAALELVITKENAKNIKARIICEAANGPTTPEADDILYKSGVFLLPDILANAGGVTVSYFEWVQNIQRLFWTEDDVNSKLRDIMSSAFKRIAALYEKHKVNMRVAAYLLAVDRVAEATRVRSFHL